MLFGKNGLVLAGIFFVLIVSAAGISAAEKNPYQKDPQSCGKCHIIKPYVESWESSQFLAHAHSMASIACLDCHQITPKQEKDNVAKFRKKAFKTPLEEREYKNDQCFRCHGSYKDIAERTKDFKGKGLSRNPHESHYGEIDCNMCHKAHRTSIDYCAQCHEPTLKKDGWKPPSN